MTPPPVRVAPALHPLSCALDLWVSQPVSVQGTEGGSVTLPCSYNSTREPRLGSYTWVKEVAGARLELSDGTQEFRGRVSRAQDRSFLRERRHSPVHITNIASLGPFLHAPAPGVPGTWALG
uniref:Uncharacterized protein n=1 Tax=Chrysemys picta bellii TaxID=8478 RepID=A0A8C3FB72_CHRPI